jgi:heme/copper-type cytochrome/quinol oxidase subunit 3
MWMFLATEILFFGGLFGAYTCYRLWYPAEFEYASSRLNRLFASINTVFLITSSLTMTLAIRSAKLGDRAGLYRNLILTFALGAAFMVLKGFEYAEDVHERYVPGPMFRGEYEAALRPVFPETGDPLTKDQARQYFEEDAKSAHPKHQKWSADLAQKNYAWTIRSFRGEYAKAREKVLPETGRRMTREEARQYFEADAKSPQPQHQKWATALVLEDYDGVPPDPEYREPGKVQLFLCFYYIMTGIHGIHIVVGLGCILWLVQQTAANRIPPENYSTVEVVSLYWHLVDAIWLFLMPLLYLAGAGLSTGGH